MIRRSLLPSVLVPFLFGAMLITHGNLWADKRLSPSEQNLLEAIGMPDGTFWGHASEALAQKLAALLCSHHNSAMEKLAHMADARDVSEARPLISRDLVPRARHIC